MVHVDKLPQGCRQGGGGAYPPHTHPSTINTQGMARKHRRGPPYKLLVASNNELLGLVSLDLMTWPSRIRGAIVPPKKRRRSGRRRRKRHQIGKLEGHDEKLEGHDAIKIYIFGRKKVKKKKWESAAGDDSGSTRRTYPLDVLGGGVGGASDELVVCGDLRGCGRVSKGEVGWGVGDASGGRNERTGTIEHRVTRWGRERE